jgi:energy-coupling factor transporter ATP-binding protein EcfA2
MAERDFQFASRTIRVEAPAAEAEWLEEFLSPQFAISRAGRPDCHARLDVNPARHADLAAFGPEPGGRLVPCFTLDGGVLAGQAWNVPGEERVVFDEAAKVFYSRGPGTSPTVDVIASEPTPGARVAIMRVVREWAMRYARRAGWLISHAAAVALDGEALVFAGPKGAGKTTLLVHTLLHADKASFIANDRTGLSLDGDKVVAAGIPTIVSLRPSAAWDPRQEARLREAQYHHRHTLAEAARMRQAGTARPVSPWSLSPRQLCQVLGVESRASAPVRTLVFPSVAPSGSGSIVEQVSPEHALDLLKGATFSLWTPESLMDIGDDRAPVRDRPPSAEEFVGRVRSVRCRLGPDAYRGGMPWLDRLRLR